MFSDAGKLREYAKPVAAGLVLCGFAAWFIAPNYNSFRPHDAQVEARLDHASAGEGLLTEDPLVLVERAARARRADPPHEAQRRHVAELAAFQAAVGRPESRLIVLWTPGGQWSEDSERRVRARHAVAQALTGLRFEVDFCRKLAVVEARGCAAPGETPWLLGYDRFSRQPDEQSESAGAAQSQTVVVLWLDESRLGEQPLGRVDDLLRALLPEPATADAAIDVLHLGPSSSGMLETLASCVPSAHKPKIWSPYATKRLSDKQAADMQARLQLERTIGADDGIAQLLVRELCERIPALSQGLGTGAASGATWLSNPLLRAAACVQTSRAWTQRVLANAGAGAPPVRVAVVAEQDSAYGRQWLKLLREAKRPPGICSDAIEFEPISYIGVIDGGPARFAGRDERGKSATPSIDERYPQGATQIDYLHRIEEQLARKRFDAVGIFGSDFYDTMLVLQVLRPRFPNVHFFTIDLDARFFHPAHLPYARNLVVASHFGLVEERAGASDEDAGLQPSFRDLYEHSLYRAVKGALAGKAPQALAPKLFEIASTGPVALGGGAEAPHVLSDTTPLWILAPIRALQQVARTLPAVAGVFAGERGGADAGGAQGGEPAGSPRSKWSWRSLVHPLAASVLWIALISTAFRPAVRWKVASRAAKLRFLASLVGPPAAVLIAVIVLAWIEDAASFVPLEPIGWFDGVSAWPSIALRMLAAAYCTWGCFEIRRRLLRVHGDVQMRHLLFGSPKQRADGVRPLSELLLGERSVALDVLWDSCGQWLHSWPRFLLRVGGNGLLIAAAFWSLDAFGGAIPPVRGWFTYVLERGSWLVSTWSFAALVFALVYAASFARKLVALISPPRLIEISNATSRASASGGSPHANRLRVPVLIVGEVLEAIDRFTWMPAVAVVLFVLLRAPIVDAWGWSPAILMGLAYLYALTLLATWRNRNAARELRQTVLTSLEVSKRRHHKHAAETERIAVLSKQVEELKTGAFAPFVRHPLVTSAVYPLLAYAATATPAGSWLNTALQALASF